MNMLYAIPVFMLLVAAEAWFVRRRGERYSLNVAVSNMSCGVLDRSTVVVYTIAFAFLYHFIAERSPLVGTFASQWWNYLLTFVLIDFCYYLYHRASHRVSLLWGAHIVHHESDEYNLTVSLRQGAVAEIVSTPFYLLIALTGTPFTVFVVANAVYQLYQFFVHTAVVDNMGWLEHVLATPRLHRLHHARNAPYIDCNYSGFFIFWDKAFGSYRPFTVEPLYGVTEPLKSWSPVWANVAYFRSLVSKATRRSGWDRVRTFVAPPEWSPSAEPQAGKRPYVAYDARPQAGRMTLALTAFGLAVVLTPILIGPSENWDWPVRVLIAAIMIASAVISTHLFDASL